MSSAGHYGDCGHYDADMPRKPAWRNEMQEIMCDAEGIVEQTLEQQRGKQCVGCGMHFPLYWCRNHRYWYHEDGGGGIVCERHPDNEDYWRLRENS